MVGSEYYHLVVYHAVAILTLKLKFEEVGVVTINF